VRVKVADIKVQEKRQRQTINQGKIDSLAVSILSNGLLNPLTVVREPDGQIILLAGYRRLLAVKKLKWDEVETNTLEDLNQLQREEIELEENIQREDLPWKEAIAANKRLADLRREIYGETFEEAADHANLSRGQLWEDAALAEALEEFPELAESKNKTQAQNRLRHLKRRSALMAQAETRRRGGSVFVEGEDFSTRVLLGDCFTIMKGWESGIIHSVITDPPYGIALDSGESKKSNIHPTIYDDAHYDIMELLALTAKEAYRLLVRDAHAYFWFDIKSHAQVLEILTNTGFAVDPIPLVWIKNMAGQTNHPDARWGSAYETCFFCRKGNRGLLKQGQSNVLKHDMVPSGKKIHPTEKPTALIRQLIESSSVPGEVVLDMFGGSGSTAEAAIQTERNFITIEKDPAYHAGIIERLSKISLMKPGSDSDRVMLVGGKEIDEDEAADWDEAMKD
jgi:site-specific DNA-methyltransferase (adenine-specific)